MKNIKRFLCTHLPKIDQPTFLSPQEAHHAIRVLRLKENSSVEAMNPQGHVAQVLLKYQQGHPRFEYDPQSIVLKNNSQTSLPILLEMSILKAQAMHWVIEKAVELNVTSFIPVLSKRCVPSMDTKTPKFFQNRWQTIADQALKQCHRLSRLEVQEPTPLSALITKPVPFRLWGHLTDSPHETLSTSLLQASNISSIHLLIGPEGGWDPEESQKLLTTPHSYPIQLGPQILRAETAALYCISALQFFLHLPFNLNSHKTE